MHGVDVHKLPFGTTLLVVTQNNLYKITKKHGSEVIVQGGKYMIEPSEAVFAGSSFGGSMLKIGWIDYGLLMEFYVKKIKKNIKTSPVKAVRILGNGWEYDMEWKTGSDNLSLFKSN